MDFAHTEEQTLLVKTARQIGEKHGLEYWRELDAKKEFPAAIWQDICDAGLCGIAVPEQYGGAGLGMAELAMAIEALCAAGGGSTLSQLFMCNPIFGGVTGLGDTYRELKSTRLVRPARDSFDSWDIFFLLTNFSTLGDQGAEQFFGYRKGSADLWMELAAGGGRNHSLYLGANDPVGRSLMLHLELQPGVAQTPRWDGNWPRREELNGQAAGVLISYVEFANYPPGKTYVAAPITLKAHEGEPKKNR